MAAADWLVCANCAGRVSEGRCVVCRAQLSRMREERGPWALLSTPAGLTALLMALAAILAVVVARPA